MKKIFTFIFKILCGFLSIIFLLGSLGGLINCFSARSNLISYIVFTLILFIIGVLLLKIAVKKQPHDQNATIGKEFSSSSDQYITDHNSIVHTDSSLITDEEIPYLIQLGYEKSIQDEKASNNPKFHRTEQEEELAFEFMRTPDKKFSTLINQFEHLYRSVDKTSDSSQRIDLLNQALAAFEQAKKYAYSKGKGGTIYFQDMYEYMHNSRNSCFSYADLIQERLEYEIKERDIIIPGILQIVRENDGILQKNVYAQLPSISKSDIQRVIRNLENEHILTRTKKSNSYELHIIK